MAEFITNLTNMMAQARANVPSQAQSPRSTVLPFEFGTKKEGYGGIGEAFGKGVSDVVMEKVHNEMDWKKKRKALTEDPEVILETFNMLHGFYLQADEKMKPTILNNPGFQQSMKNANKFYPGLCTDQNGTLTPPSKRLNMEETAMNYFSGLEEAEKKDFLGRTMKADLEGKEAKTGLTVAQTDTEGTRAKVFTSRIGLDAAKILNMEDQSAIDWYNAKTASYKATGVANEKATDDYRASHINAVTQVYAGVLKTIQHSRNANLESDLRRVDHSTHAGICVSEAREFINALDETEYMDPRARELVSQAIGASEMAMRRLMRTPQKAGQYSQKQLLEAGRLYNQVAKLAGKFVMEGEGDVQYTLLAKDDLNLLRWMKQMVDPNIKKKAKSPRTFSFLPAQTGPLPPLNAGM